MNVCIKQFFFLHCLYHSMNSCWFYLIIGLFAFLKQWNQFGQKRRKWDGKREIAQFGTLDETTSKWSNGFFCALLIIRFQKPNIECGRGSQYPSPSNAFFFSYHQNPSSKRTLSSSEIALILPTSYFNHSSLTSNSMEITLPLVSNESQR